MFYALQRGIWQYHFCGVIPTFIKQSNALFFPELLSTANKNMHNRGCAKTLSFLGNVCSWDRILLSVHQACYTQNLIYDKDEIHLIYKVKKSIVSIIEILTATFKNYY